MGEPMADFGGDFGRRERQVGGGIGNGILRFAHGRTEILSVLTPRALSHPLRVGFINTPNHPQETRRKTMAKRIVDVLIPVALDQSYSYRAPADLERAVGDLVRVPWGTAD